MVSKTQSKPPKGWTEQDSEITAEQTDDSETLPDQEEIFEVLSNERRRYVLAYLKQHENGEVDFGTLVTNVAALENDTSVEQVTSSDRKSVYVGLRQSHLPKMDDYGLVEYDSDRGTIELTEAAEHARMYLEYVPENDIPWCYHYLGLSALFGVMAALRWFELPLFGEVGWIVLALLAPIVFGISAVVHTVYMHRRKLGRSIDVESEG